MIVIDLIYINRVLLEGRFTFCGIGVSKGHAGNS